MKPQQEKRKNCAGNYQELESRETTEKILIVDDNHDICKLLQLILKLSGYQVLLAENGREGLTIALEQKPDLIILDNHMPVMDGISMLSALRKTDQHTPVIFMTAFGSEQIAIEAFRLGINNYLIKPFITDDVKLTTEWALREARLRREKEQLDRNLLIAETVQRTMVTLAHHINNQLTIIDSGFTLLSESLNQQLDAGEEARLQNIIHAGQKSLTNIAAVLRVLQKVSQIELVEYHEQVQMINIEAELRYELAR